MRSLYEKIPKGPALSVLLHVVVILLLIVVRINNEPLQQTEVILQIPDVQNEPKPKSASKPKAPSVEPEEPVVDLPAEHVEPVKESPVKTTDSAKTDTAKKFDRLRFYTRSPMLEYTQSLDSLHIDSTDTINISPTGPFFDMGDTTRFSTLPGPHQDRVQRDLYRQQLGHAKPLPLNQAIGQGAKYLSDMFSKNEKEKPVRLDFVPSEAELDILQTLWEQPKSTDVYIYAALDTSIHLTAVDLNSVLERLSQKGLLTRQLVSPRNEFTFPLGKVEMSAKNRKNRVYQYESRIAADEVMRYLQAVLYNVEHGQTPSDSSNSEFVKSLKKKIQSLLESSG